MVVVVVGVGVVVAVADGRGGLWMVLGCFFG